MATHQAASEEIRQTELRRIKALAARDLAVADDIVADDFQLIAPSGMVFSKEQYLGAVKAGVLRYIVWEAVSPIDVRLYGEAAIIRYQANIDIEVEGKKVPAGLCWFTDAYELREGRWRIVWSQGTRAAA